MIPGPYPTWQRRQQAIAGANVQEPPVPPPEPPVPPVPPVPPPEPPVPPPVPEPPPEPQPPPQWQRRTLPASGRRETTCESPSTARRGRQFPAPHPACARGHVSRRQGKAYERCLKIFDIEFGRAGSSACGDVAEAACVSGGAVDQYFVRCPDRFARAMSRSSRVKTDDVLCGHGYRARGCAEGTTTEEHLARTKVPFGRADGPWLAGRHAWHPRKTYISIRRR